MHGRKSRTCNKRRNAIGVETEGKIFLAGEMQQTSMQGSWSKICEMHNISSNEWQLIGRFGCVSRLWQCGVSEGNTAMCWVATILVYSEC